VTITGADSRIDIDHLMFLSEKYRFVEWGILFSPSRQGSSRYPNMLWVEDLILRTMSNSQRRKIQPNLSAHLCGDYTREYITTGRMDMAFANLRDVMFGKTFSRFQLNFNSNKYPVCKEFYESLERMGTTIILQHNQANHDMCEKVITEIKNRNIHFLYDGSGGRGVAPDQWKTPVKNHFTGYAGGLNPDNLEEQLIKINEVVGDGEIWIDAETGLRTDEELDLKKVIKFLEIASKYQ